MSNDNRWSKFWWQDWQGDPSLRMVSLAAQGLWMRLLCLAHEGTPVGHVTVAGRAPNLEQISAIVGEKSKKVKILLDELENSCVFSRTEDGTIFCRRMVRDASRSEEGKRHISKRWGSDGTPPPNRSPSSPPTDEPIRKPNGAAMAKPIGNLLLEAEAESEEDRGKGEGTDSLPSARAVAPAPRRPEDWQLSIPMIAFGLSLGLSEPDIVLAADQMRDWMVGNGRRLTDWDARFRHWLREDAQKSKRPAYDQNPVSTLMREWGTGSIVMGHYDPPDDCNPAATARMRLLQ